MELRLLSEDYYRKLFDFEVRNRTWFEKLVPSRSPDYFIYDKFKKIISGLISEQKNGEGLFYLILINHRVVGRVNFTNIHKHIADLGYRICESISARGITFVAIREAIDLVHQDFGIVRINAKTTDNNRASIKIMEKTGFEYIKTIDNAVTLNGKTLNFICYRLTI